MIVVTYDRLNCLILDIQKNILSQNNNLNKVEIYIIFPRTIAQIQSF